jgi:hypothetical protein
MRALILWLALATVIFAADVTPEGIRWWSHIQVLADDKMEGRNTGSDGHRRAAQYVAGAFERAGLKPAGTSGYFQPVMLSVRSIDEPASSLELVRGGEAAPMTLGEDASFNLRVELAPHVDAPAVFVGHGLVIPEIHLDELAGLDLKGKIAVYINGGPKSIPSELKAHYSSAGERWKAYQKAGAIGIAAIPNPKSMDIPWDRAKLARLNPTMSLTDKKLDDTMGLQFAVTVNPANAEKIFASSGHTFAEILKLADAGQPLPHFPLNAGFRANVKLGHSQAESPNVVAVRPGSDPKLKNEYVVFSAHLDHVGIGQPINGDRIYNGAMDDASGVASLIEIATMMKERDLHLERSVLFVAVTGEEKGELGSTFFATFPTVPRKAIVADINMDMYLPLFPLKYLEVQGLAESTLGNDIRAACEKAGVQVQADKEPDRNLFIRSDQYSFVKHGTPALAFKFGYLPGSPEEKVAKNWLKVRYHAPSDDLNQPVDKTAAAQFNRILLDVGERVANAAERPQWNQNSFFKRFAAND